MPSRTMTGVYKYKHGLRIVRSTSDIPIEFVSVVFVITASRLLRPADLLVQVGSCEVIGFVSVIYLEGKCLPIASRHMSTAITTSAVGNDPHCLVHRRCWRRISDTSDSFVLASASHWSGFIGSGWAKGFVKPGICRGDM